MNITIFAPYFYPHKGGLEQFCWEVATRLAKSKKHHVTVVSSKTDGEPQQEEISGVKIVRLDTWDFLSGTFPIPKSSRNNQHLFNQIFSIKQDAVITNTRFFPLTLVGLFLAKKYKIRSFHIEHGTRHSKLANFFYSFLAWFYDQTLGRMVFSLADHHLAISKAAAEFSRKLGGREVKIVYNCVDTSFFTPPEKTGEKSSIKLLFIGRLIKAKGVQDLITAFGNIQNPKVKLDIIGSGNYQKQLKKQAASDPRISFLGQQDQSGIMKSLAEADIFINPSLSEGLPTSVLEAGSMGLAIIATDVGGTSEIIDDEENGLLVPAENPEIIEQNLQYLINNPHIRQEFGVKIRAKIVKQFDWSNNIQFLINLIEND